MRLSEAMRLGAMWRPQGFGQLWQERVDGSFASCALGAAFEALGCAPGTSVVRLRGATWRWLAMAAGCPACHRAATREWVIEHLNDWHNWTREAIADWVETIERHESPASVAAVDPSASGPGTPAPRVDGVSS